MNYLKYAWIGGAVVLASILDLGYMFWSRSNPGQNFRKAGWHSGMMGKGRFDLMKMGRMFDR